MQTPDRDLYSGLIRLHVLHHAAEGPIFGLGMIEELARHGYRISAGTIYPLLQGLERKGYLRSTEERNGKSLRRVYRATPQGRRALIASKVKVRELFHELIRGDWFRRPTLSNLKRQACPKTLPIGDLRVRAALHPEGMKPP